MNMFQRRIARCCNDPISSDQPPVVPARPGDPGGLTDSSKIETAEKRQFSRPGETLWQMYSFCTEKVLTDVVLIAGELEIPAHKVVLSAVSKYFLAMFTSGLKEEKQDKIEIKDIDADILNTLVQYCYVGCLDLEKDNFNVESVLEAASFLQIDNAVEECCAFLEEQLNHSNCIHVRRIAHAHGFNNLVQAAETFLRKNFTAVIEEEEFRTLQCDELHQLLEEEDLNVSSEEDILLALVSWLNHDLDNRKAHILRLFPCVRLPLLSPSFIADNILSLPVFRENLQIVEKIMESFKYHLLPERCSLTVFPRSGSLGCMYAVGGMNADGEVAGVEIFDAIEKKWMVSPGLTIKRLQCGVTVVDGKLYFAGGRDGLKVLKTFQCYDPETRRWRNLHMAAKRYGLGVVALDGFLYAVGGHNEWSYLNLVERWNPGDNTWLDVTPMLTRRSTLGVAALDGKLYAVGGRDGNSFLATVECYNPSSRKWTFLAPMTRGRGNVGVGVLNGYLYAVGGQDRDPSMSVATPLASVERYNPKTDKWQLVASMSTQRESVGVCVFGERLFAAGGFDGKSYLNLVEMYDQNEDKWYEVESLTYGRAGLGLVVVPKGETQKK